MANNEEIQLPVNTDQVATMLTKAIERRRPKGTTKWGVMRFRRDLQLIPMSCTGANCEFIGNVTEAECAKVISTDKWDELVTEATEKINESE